MRQVDVDWMKLRRWARAMGRQAAVVPALGALLLVGAVAVSAAPTPGTSSASQQGATSFSRADTRQSSLVGAVTAAGSATVGPTATTATTTKQAPTTATATPTKKAPAAPALNTPAPTATATATATPIPPTPTATPAPTWHTLGSYSGSGAGPFATLTLASGGPVRVDWTCQTTQAQPSWNIAFNVINATDGTGGQGAGQACDASHLSGSMQLSNPLAPGNWRFGEGACSGSGCPTDGAWTATVYEWY